MSEISVLARSAKHHLELLSIHPSLPQNHEDEEEEEEELAGGPARAFGGGGGRYGNFEGGSLQRRKGEHGSRTIFFLGGEGWGVGGCRGHSAVAV